MNAASNAASVSTRSGSGTDQCTAWAGYSSWARSHTVTMKSASFDDVVHELRDHSVQAEAMPPGDLECTGRDPVGGVRPGTECGDVAGLVPQHLRELGPCGVRGAHEHHPLSTGGDRRTEVGQRIRDQRHIRAAAVSFGPAAGDDALALQHVQVMREKIRRHPDLLPQLCRREIAESQQVDHPQPGRVGESGMLPRPGIQTLLSVHCLNLD